MESAMKIKVEPEDGDLITSCIDIEEHPVKLEDEEEQTDTLICGLPAPDTKFLDQEQSHEISYKCDNIEAASKPSLDKVLKFRCEHCFKLLVSKRTLHRHIKLVHGERTHSCDVCGKRFARNAGLQSHLLTHSSKPLLECTKCDKKYRNVEALHQHNTTIHLGIKYECNLCGKMYTSKNGISKHKKLVHSVGKVESFECDICKKIFKMKELFTRHIKNVHLDLGKYPCDICHKPMKNKNSLASHKRFQHRINNKGLPLRTGWQEEVWTQTSLVGCSVVVVAQVLY